MAKNETVKFKISLDESKFINGLKKVKSALGDVAKDTKNVTSANGKATVALVELTAKANDFFKTLHRSKSTYQNEAKRLNELISDYDRYAQILKNLDREEQKTTGIDAKLVKLAQVNDKYKEMIKLAAQQTTSEKGEKAIFQYEKDDDAKIMRARVELERLNDALIRLRPFENFFKNLAKNIGTGLANAFKKAASGAQELKQGFALMRNVMSQGIDSIRQITQGFLSMGRALTFFIAIPFTAWLKESIEFATEFEEAMARVTKVAGWDKDAFGIADIRGEISKELNLFIRDLSSVSAAGQLQYAQWAEDLAQFGVKSVDLLKQYLPMMEMIVAGTDVAASDAAKRLGNVANAFGITMSDETKHAEDFVWRMINVINILENNVGASADQILTAVEAAGPTLSQLGVEPWVVASWAALGVEVGLSAEEVGTSLRNIGVFVARNYKKAYNETGSFLQEMYGSATEFNKALLTDFSGTFQAIIEKASSMNNPIEAISQLFDLLGMRGGKWASAMMRSTEEASNALEKMNRIVEITAEQWRNPTSLTEEYATAQQTLSHQSKLLKNNINNLALAVGDTLIPELVKLVQSAMPIVRAFSNLFTSLDEGTKKMLFIGSAVVAISGPLLFFFSQMAFGASLIMSGLIKLGGVFGTLIKVFGIFGSQLIKLNPVAWLFAGTISKAFGMAQNSVSGAVRNIADMIKGLAQMMPQWGKGIFSGLATGINNAQGLVLRAINNIAGLIAGFFRAFSPPKEGPLQHIDKWGTTLFDTYLKGFLKADFGILKDVAGYVQHVLESWIDIGKIGEDGTLQHMLLQFRQDLAGLLARFNEFGTVADSAIRAITDRFGEASDELFKLIKLNLQLKSIIEDIADIEERKSSVTQGYRDQVRALMKSNMSLEDQAKLLGKMQQERDTDLAILDEEQEALERRKDTIEGELDLHKQMLDAYKDQDNIYADMLAAIEKLEEAIEDMADELSGAGDMDVSADLSGLDLGGMDFDALEDGQMALAEFGDAMLAIQAGALKLELILRGVFTSIAHLIRKQPIDSLEEFMLNIDDMDERIKDFAVKSFKNFANLEEGTEDYTRTVQGLADIFGKDFLKAYFDGDEELRDSLDKTGKKTEAITLALAELDEEDLSGFRSTLDGVEASSGGVFTVLEEVGEEMKDLYSGVMLWVEPAYKKIRAFFLALSGLEIDDETMTMTVDVDGVPQKVEIDGIDKIIEAGRELNELFGVLEERLPNIIKLVGQIGENLLSNLGIDLSLEEGDISGDVDAILGAVEGFLQKIASKDKPINWIIGAFILFNLVKASIGTGLQLSATWFLKTALPWLAAWAELSVTGGYFLTATLPILVTIVASIVWVKQSLNLFQNAEDLIEGGEEEKGIKMLENYINVFIAGMGGVLVDIPVTPNIELDSESGTQVVSDLKNLLSYGPKVPLNILIDTDDPFGIKAAMNGFLPDIAPSFSEAGSSAGSNFLNGVTTALSQPITLSTLGEIETLAGYLDITPDDLLSENFKDQIDIEIPAPTFSFIGDIDAKIKELVDQIVEPFNEFFNPETFTISPEDGAVMAKAIVDALLGAMAGVEVASEIMGVLATRLAEQLYNQYTEGGSGTAVAQLKQIGDEWARIIEEGLSSTLFSTESGKTILEFTALIESLKTASENLADGFETAGTQLANILTNIQDVAWTNFMDDAVTLAGEDEGSIAKGFNDGYDGALRLQEFLEGDFSNSLQTAVDLFNQLMQGFWNIKITIVYDAVKGQSQTGSPAYANSTRLVGESGRELFSPPVDGHITSHSQLSNMLSQLGQSDIGGKGKEFNFNIQGSPVTITEEELFRMQRKAEFLYG